MTTKTDYVRLVRDAEGTIIDSFDANPEFEAMRIENKLLVRHIADLRELIDNLRRIALEADVARLKVAS